MPGRACLAALALSASILLPTGAFAERSGLVFVDANGNGALDAGEPGRAGVAVSDGHHVVESGPDGRFRLPPRELSPPSFVHVTCPADASCPVWFHRDPDAGASIDFALAPAPVPASGDLFFVHVTDAHVYPRVEDMAALLPDGGLPWFVPRVLAGWLLLHRVDRMYPQHSREHIVAAIREVVSQHRDVSDAWDASVAVDYLELALDPATGIADPGRDIPRAFDEIAALSPDFVVNTGDLVMEGNSGSPEAVERWFDYYVEMAGRHDLEIYETIGNNELGGTSNDDFPPSDPRYGRALFQRHFGPSWFSFERGPFHFAVVDTHRPDFDPREEGADGDWSFYDMEDAVRDWLDADLARARAAGRRIVVLNHEPFYYDPAWEFDDPTPADDQGLLAKHAVDYELSGHIHRNGFEDAPESGGTTRITTGALSGFRWMLPLTIDSRGYRLIYAHEGRLYSAWKDLDEPLLGFVAPRGAAAIHPASTHAAAPEALKGRVEVVAVGVDVDRPFASLELRLDGRPLESRAWGAYFVHAHLDASTLGPDSRLEVRARSAGGSEASASLRVASANAPKRQERP